MPRRKKDTPAIRHRQDNAPFTTLEALYTELNGELFGGRLPKVAAMSLEWVHPLRAKGFLGRITPRWSGPTWAPFPARKAIGARIEVRTGMTDRQTRKTMAHEMAHLAAAIEDGTLKHNATFWRIMAEIGYPKDHRFLDEAAEEKDCWTDKSEARDAVRFWRTQPLGSQVRMEGAGVYTLVEVQRRGTQVRIKNSTGMTWWVSARWVKPL
jgi:hypothetical protein